MAFILAAILVLAPFVVLMLAGNPLDRFGPKPADDPPALVLSSAEQARCEVEGLLVRRLVAGDLDRAARARAMADLVVRDARSRPLRVPGDPTG
ncbi:hypothetical protein GCM10009557_76060 [Virgisporangium ochraceum]